MKIAVIGAAGKAGRLIAGEALDLFRASDMNWTFFSLRAFLTPRGRGPGATPRGRCGHPEEQGKSCISCADFAVFLVDELEQGKHIRERITAVSEG